MKRLFFITLILVCFTVLLAFTTVAVSASGTQVTYKITTKICNGFQNGTNSNKVNFTFYGTNGTHTIENLGRKIKGDAFERNKTDTYEFSCLDLGQIYGLNVSCGTDAVKFEYIKIEKNGTLMANFSICEWIDNTDRTYYTNKDKIYRIKIVTGDNPLDGTSNGVTMTVKDSTGKSFDVNVLNAAKQSYLQSGSEQSFYFLASTALSNVSQIKLTLNSNGKAVDEWHPLYVQIERMSNSTEKASIKWENEVLFVCDSPIRNALTVNSYGGKVNSDKASALASIFFEPNFYVILVISLALIGSGVAVYFVKKKKGERK